MNPVEVFKTNVCDRADAESIIGQLSLQQPESQINFDLEDCDHILRVESRSGEIDVRSVIELLNKNHFICELLNLKL
ncbi:MAG: hypothetical protein V1904_00430 [Bacteroidota bacterium]